MLLLLLALASFSCALVVNVPGIPCSPFTTTDPVSGRSYTYNLTALAIPNPKPNSAFLVGTEAGSKWEVSLNICGLSSVVGCATDTPACQNDGSGNFFSLGTASSWSFQTYYDPNTTALQYDGGVVVTINNGNFCRVMGVFRKAVMFFKCDPSVTVLPNSFEITEYDPVTQYPTPCFYHFGVIRHKCFCPGGCPF